jgi:mediator of replication checkpoint protein 1
MVPGTSSPTPALIRVSKKANSDDEFEEVYKPLKDFKDLINEEQLRAEVVEARRRILERKKQERLRILKWTGKGRDVGNSDDELSILPKGQPAVRFADVKPSASRKTPRGFIDDYVNSNGGKHRQVALQFTGKKPVKEEVTETMAEFAGKTFKHADLRTMNGGSRPAGQMVNRDKAITQANLDAMTMKEHRQQAQRIQRKKEQDFGVRKKHIPARETRDYNTELAELQAIEARRYQARDDEEEDEDPEDGDYQGSGEEEDDEVEVDLDEEVVQYSGEEDGVEGEEGAAEEDEQKSDSETEIEIDQDEQIHSASKDKIETNEEASSPPKVDSLAAPEQETPRPAQGSAAKVSVARANPTPQALESTFVDVSGFGSGGGSPGFSQLFEATQAPGFGETVRLSPLPTSNLANIQDAFAGLRDQHAGLLPANAMLPQVDISATQIERDNAVIAADLEDEDADVVEDRPRTQYMNEKGYVALTRILVWEMANPQIVYADKTPSSTSGVGSILAKRSCWQFCHV